MRPFQWTRLTWPIGNNAFAYEQRKRTDPNPQLRLPDLKTISSIEEIELWTLHTFAELDDNDSVITYTGLKHIYHMLFCTDAFSCVPSSTDEKNLGKKRWDIKNYVPTTVPIYIFDNHNYALYFWAKYVLDRFSPNPSPLRRGEGVGGVGVRCIHIDQHSDLGTPPKSLVHDDRSYPQKNGESYSPLQHMDIAHYTTHVCNVGNFIRPALDAGIISECIRIKNEYDLNQTGGSYPPLQNRKQEGYILDIDLDFRAPGMWTDLDITIPLVQSLMREASLVTIASSPYFLDQTYALQLLKKLFER